ncbi:hypothetical protein ZTR_03423 [Talaromyces verruculosus]|nr:hypothetical protein ZTR_03423 [Talaromyces verruculosus]
MHTTLRHTTRLSNAKILVERALTKQNAAGTYTPTARGSQSIQSSHRNIQTTPNLWTAQHEQNTDRLINRDALNPSRSEGTGTGTDDEVASHDSSFDPKNTAPESEMEAVGRESEARKDTSSPLDVSPGNREVNKTGDPSQDPPESGVDRPASAKGWTRKGKAVNQDKIR